jgi:RNA polymerase sigma factor (sigma-70 family)
MVRGVCRRVLSNDHDAEDAFQATFLVLARRARSIRKSESVGSWLYGVAYRISARVRADAARRQSLEVQARNMAENNPIDELTWRELRPVLDEELDRLPAKYRAPVVLCYLEGKTNTEAARELGWTKGTVSGRLARARDLLRQRLARRGVALTSALLATLLPSNAQAAGLSESLLAATVTAATHDTAGTAVGAGIISERVSHLAAGALQGMTSAPSGRGLKVALVLGMVLTGTGLVAYPYLEGDQDDIPFAKCKDKEEPWEVLVNPLRGVWLVDSREKAGHPIAVPDDFSCRLVFTGQTLSIHDPAGNQKYQFTADPSTDPPQIDLRDGDKVYKGIYRDEGRSLQICWGQPGEERPTEFTTHENTGETLVILRRFHTKLVAE